MKLNWDFGIPVGVKQLKQKVLQSLEKIVYYFSLSAADNHIIPNSI